MIFAIAALVAAAAEPAVADNAIHLKRLWIGTERQQVFGVARRGKELWTIGSFGVKLQRAGSTSWITVLPPPDEVPLAITFAPSGAGVMVGQEGNVWELAPDSYNVSQKTVPGAQRLFSVAASPAGEFAAVGSFGTIVDRPANSDQWRLVPGSWAHGPLGSWEGPHLYDVLFTAPDEAIAVGERTTVLTLKGGQITSATHDAQFGEESLFAIVGCGGRLVAAGQQGIVLVGSPAGWQVQHMADQPDVFALSCMSGNRLIAATTGSFEVGTPSGNGWNWERWETNPDRVTWFSTVVPDGDGALVAGQGGIWRAPFPLPGVDGNGSAGR